MMRLLWKEIRERGWAHLIWALAIIFVTVFRPATSFFGQKLLFRLYSDVAVIALPAFLALIAGSCAYNSELVKDRASFVFARPVAWWMMLLAKIIPGIIVLLITPLISVSLYYAFGPEVYRSYMTANNVISGIWQIIWPSALVYLLSCLCAPVLSGYAGGAFTIGAVGIISSIVSGILLVILPDRCFTYFTNNEIMSANIAIVFGALAGGIILTRFAVRLDVRERMLRFLRIIAMLLAIGLLIGCLIPDDWRIPSPETAPQTTHKASDLEVVDWSASPGGKNALVRYGVHHGSNGSSIEKSQIIDLTSGNVVMPYPQELLKQGFFFWGSDDIGYISHWIDDDIKLVNIFQISSNKQIKMTIKRWDSISFSLDSKYLLLHRYPINSIGEVIDSSKGKQVTTCFSFPEMKEITTFGMNYHNRVGVHWLDENTFAYLDTNNKPQTIKLPE